MFLNIVVFQKVSFFEIRFALRKNDQPVFVADYNVESGYDTYILFIKARPCPT